MKKILSILKLFAMCITGEKMSEEKVVIDDNSFDALIECADSLRNAEVPIFRIDGTQENNAAALKFLKNYNFVVVDQSPESEFLQNCTRIKPTECSGHNAFAFLHQQPLKTIDSFENTAEPQLIELLDKEMSDFIPDATAHSQEAWNLRCDAVLRQFFSSVYGESSSADQLLPSIESFMQCDSSDASFPFSIPTLNYNPTWSRAPHVISAYHLHAHYSALQSYYTEYLEHAQCKKSDNSLDNNRNKQKWLHRLQKELIATAKKVILGKRATNQMVQDAAFHSKKDGIGEKETCIEAMRPLQAGYEAFILTNIVDSNSLTLELVPGFDQYYSYYLACRRNKWANVGADCLIIPAEDEYSKAIFDRCSVQVTLRPGATLIISRTTPRWISGGAKCTFLPLSYRWQKNSVMLLQDCDLSGNSGVLDFAQICPFELALNATYQKSIHDGIVFTSLPHLTGATQQFSRSTKKTSQSLKLQRQQTYNAWLLTLAKKSDRNLPQYHYSAPKIAPYLVNLMEQETCALKVAFDCLKIVSQLVVEEENEAEEALKVVPEVKCDKSTKKRKREVESEKPFDVFSSEHPKLSENCFAECEMLVPTSIFQNELNEPYDELRALMQEFGGFE